MNHLWYLVLIQFYKTDIFLNPKPYRTIHLHAIKLISSLALNLTICNPISILGQFYIVDYRSGSSKFTHRLSCKIFQEKQRQRRDQNARDTGKPKYLNYFF